MKTKTSQLVLIFASLNFVLVPFQNCSPPIQSDFASEVISESQSVVPDPNQPTGTSSSPVVVTPAPVPVVVTPAPTLPTGTTKTIFMATGHMGRTLMSCDDGKTWINDRSDNNAAICGGVTTDPNYVECNHTPYTSRGIDAGQGYFYANYGWGYNGSLKRSRDGKNWDVIKSGGWGGGIAWGPNQLFHVHEGGRWSLSNTNGTSWSQLTDPVRSQFSYPAVKRVNDKIFVFGRSTKLGLSTDQGNTWKIQDIVTPFGDFSEGRGLIVAVGFLSRTGLPTVGYTYVSKDNGLTWITTTFLDSSLYHEFKNVIFNGTEFVTWARDRVYKSVDGLNWVRSYRKIDGIAPHSGVNYTHTFNQKTGTYISVNGSYSSQKIYRSTDGVNWTTLSASQYKGGHPIISIITGELDSSNCP